MSVTTTTHLNFDGGAREALEFYQSVFGGTLTVVTYRDLGAPETPAEADNVVWGQVSAPNGFQVMAYDVQSSRKFDRGTDAFYVSVRGDSAAEIEGYWAGLSKDAVVRTPLGPAVFSPLYGMLTDRYGVTWVIDVAVEYAG